MAPFVPSEAMGPLEWKRLAKSSSDSTGAVESPPAWRPLRALGLGLLGSESKAASLSPLADVLLTDLLKAFCRLLPAGQRKHNIKLEGSKDYKQIRAVKRERRDGGGEGRTVRSMRFQAEHAQELLVDFGDFPREFALRAIQRAAAKGADPRGLHDGLATARALRTRERLLHVRAPLSVAAHGKDAPGQLSQCLLLLHTIGIGPNAGDVGHTAFESWLDFDWIGSWEERG